jgi:hypothetical protein
VEQANRAGTEDEHGIAPGNTGLLLSVEAAGQGLGQGGLLKAGALGYLVYPAAKHAPFWYRDELSKPSVIVKAEDADMRAAVIRPSPAGRAPAAAYAGGNLYPAAGLKGAVPGVTLRYHPAKLVPQDARVDQVALALVVHLDIGGAD